MVLPSGDENPSSSGNDRMSRLLSLPMLYKSGFDAGKYVSFEKQINEYTTYYYDSLKQSSIGCDTNENNSLNIYKRCPVN